MVRKDEFKIEPIIGKKINKIMQKNLSFFEYNISINNKML